MVTSRIERVSQEILEDFAGFDWEHAKLNEAETFAVQQVLSHGPLSHNASTLKCLEAAVGKANRIIDADEFY